MKKTTIKYSDGTETMVEVKKNDIFLYGGKNETHEEIKNECKELISTLCEYGCSEQLVDRLDSMDTADLYYHRIDLKEEIENYKHIRAC